MRRRRLEWFGYIKRADETENIRSVVELKMGELRPRGSQKLRWGDKSRRDLNAWNIGEEWATEWNDGMVSTRPAFLHRETAAKGEKVRTTHQCLSLHLENGASYILYVHWLFETTAMRRRCFSD